MHLKVFLKLKKKPKTLSSGQKNPKKTLKKTKQPKKPTGLGFLQKTQVFSNPDLYRYLPEQIGFLLELLSVPDDSKVRNRIVTIIATGNSVRKENRDQCCGIVY
jgi:hypothetical protein